jgi:hypothetical protein
MQLTVRNEADGRAAIATAFAGLYGYDVRPTHWGTHRPMEQGGEDPLDGVSAFAAENHWHYVTYGLTQLTEQTGSFPAQPGMSGFGFELTFRLRRESQAPPVWPVEMLQRLARYVFRSSNPLRPGDHMALNGPLAGSDRSALQAVLFTLDPQLAPITTRHGEVRFVQVVGITLDELDAVKDWRCEGFLELVARVDPLLTTDLHRHSLLNDAHFLQACRMGARSEGSSHGSSFASEVRWQLTSVGLELTVGAIAVPDLQRMLRLRLPYNRSYRLHGRRGSVRFKPGLRGGFRVDGRELTIEVPWDAAAGMAETLQPQRGTYDWPGIRGLTVIVKPTDVRGGRGELIRVIG